MIAVYLNIFLSELQNKLNRKMRFQKSKNKLNNWFDSFWQRIVLNFKHPVFNT